MIFCRLWRVIFTLLAFHKVKNDENPAIQHAHRKHRPSPSNAALRVRQSGRGVGSDHSAAQGDRRAAELVGVY